MIKTSRYFKKLFNEIKERKEEGLLENASALTNDRLTKKFLTCYRKLIGADEKKLSKLFSSRMKKTYNSYMKDGVFENNRGVKQVSIFKLKPKFRKELNNRIVFSLSLIKTQNKGIMQKLSDRFLNWLNNETIGGNDKSLRETLALSKTQQVQSRHYNFILKDQTRKMLTNIDNIIAKDCNAIGFYWKTRRDNRVVGNPIGLYPKATNKDVHGNHFKRQGQFYFYKNTWVTKNRLIDTSKIEWAEFDDGMPGEPIGCRCYAENIYDFEDVPEEFLSDKGKEYLENL